MSIFQLPTFLVGPSQGARSSTFLERSGPPDEIPESERRLLNDLPLGLAGWMRRREENEIFGCLPLSRAPMGGRMLFRAIYLSDLGGEPYGLAVGVYVPRGLLIALNGHTEKLAGLLPLPERGTSFTASPLECDPVDLPHPAVPVTIGLEWQDRAVLVRDGTRPLDVASQLLSGLGHSPQDRRVRGWITTSRFPRLGGIDPRGSFQLVVSAASLPEDPYPSGTWSEGAYHGEMAPTPPSWNAWQALYAHLVKDPELADACNWSGNLATLAPANVTEGLIQRLLAWPIDGPRLFVHLLARLGEAGIVSDPARLVRDRILELDDPGRASLLSVLLRAGRPILERLGTETLLREFPELTTVLEPLAFEVALSELGLLDWPELGQRHLFGLAAEQRFAALEYGLVKIESDPACVRRIEPLLQALVNALINEEDSLIQSDPRTAALVRQIDRAESTGLARLVEPGSRYTFGYWLRGFPPAVGAPVRQRFLKVVREFPRDPGQMAFLADLISAVNRSRIVARGGLHQ